MIFRQTLRDTAIAMLKAANTLAGDQVSKEQAAPSPEAGLPLLAVYVPLEHKTSISEGGDPLFRAALTLHIEARVANADPVQVVTDLDTLVDQAQVALLSNPDFLRRRPGWWVEYVTEIVVRTEVDGSGETYIGKGLIALTITYRDEYKPMLPDELQRIVMTIKPQLGVPPPPAPWASSVTSETSFAVP